MGQLRHLAYLVQELMGDVKIALLIHKRIVELDNSLNALNCYAKALAEAGIVLAEGALPKAFNENFLLYLAMTRAEQHLTISYAGSNDEGEGLESSLVIKRLQSLGFCTSPIEVPFTIQDGTEDDPRAQGHEQCAQGEISQQYVQARL